MLNNKGFAVSSVLYTLLIAFLMFLGALLAQFSSSINIIGKANNDIINETNFIAEQVRFAEDETHKCGEHYKWYQTYENNKLKNSGTIVRIKSKYGTMYWPKDFVAENEPNIKIEVDNNQFIESGLLNGNIKVDYDPSTYDKDKGFYGKLTFTDIINNKSDDVELSDMCS